jgi:ATP-dependent exoDNAse (exonuclease V) alpha subunit
LTLVSAPANRAIANEGRCIRLRQARRRPFRDPAAGQSIETGAAFRSIVERHGGAEIGEVRRQREGWQRDATRDLATGRNGEAIEAYDTHGMVHEAASREQARENLIDRWDRDRLASPDQSRIISYVAALRPAAGAWAVTQF